MDHEAYFPELSDVMKAQHVLSEILDPTPLVKNRNLSLQYQANVLLKREDLQMVRSYKIRGAYYKIKSLSEQEAIRGVVCASAGNHAQGVAYSCSRLGIKGRIYMPVTTPAQKIEQVKMFGGEFVEVILVGDTFDAANKAAIEQCERDGALFIPPFDDPRIIEGQATVGLEILQSFREPIDYVFVPVGGGGLISGIGSVFRRLSPSTKIIGVEPCGAASMNAALESGKVVSLDEIDKFVDGTAVQRVGDLTYALCRKVCDDMLSVPEGKVCTTILKLYNSDAIVVEPAGALSISALDFFREQIKGKTVACIVSGSNNDITRMEEIKERSLLYEGLKHYFIVRFPQRSGALKSFVSEVLGPTDDITFFEYKKKTAREKGPAIIGIEVKQKENYDSLVRRMERQGIKYQYLNDNPILFELLI